MVIYFLCSQFLKGLPLSYFKDLQDDKEIVFSSYDMLINCLKIFNEILKNITPNKKEMYKLADNGFILQLLI